MHRKDPASPLARTAALEQLDERARKVAEHITQRRHISRNVSQELDSTQGSLGQRAADAVARFGGSWTFVILFGLTMLTWVSLNTLLLVWRGSTFDPSPTFC